MKTSLNCNPLLIVVATIGLGGVIGATTNAINGVISPHYFRKIMNWDDVEQVWRASVAQGIFEGLLYGILFAIIIAIVIGFKTGGICPIRLMLNPWRMTLSIIYGSWLAGGIIAIGLASLSPEFYRNTFYGVPDDRSGMLGYAWVGGSIWGAEIGAVISAIISAFALSASLSEFTNSPSRQSTAEQSSRN